MYIIPLLSSEGDFCGQVDQSVKYGHSCLELVFLIKTGTNNPSCTSVFLESSAKPRLDCQFDGPGLGSQKIQEPLTQGANLFNLLGFKVCMSIRLSGFYLYLVDGILFKHLRSAQVSSQSQWFLNLLSCRQSLV